jgi:hypothetical protein
MTRARPDPARLDAERAASPSRRRRGPLECRRIANWTTKGQGNARPGPAGSALPRGSGTANYWSGRDRLPFAQPFTGPAPMTHATKAV